MTTTDNLDNLDIDTVTPAIGQVGTIRIRANDPDRAVALFGQLLGWQSERYQGDGYVDHHMINTAIHLVLTDEPDAPPVRLFFGADASAAAAARIEELGGRIINSELTADGGGWARAEDDQGTPI